MAVELKEFCNRYTSKINEEIRNGFKEYFLGKYLSRQIYGEIDEYSQKLYYRVIKDVLDKHNDIVRNYVNSILKIKENYHANFATIYAIRYLFERGILSIQENRNIEVLAENEDIIDYFLAVSNSIIEGYNENDLAFLDRVDFSGCNREIEELQELFRDIYTLCDNICRFRRSKKEEELEKLVDFLVTKNFIKFNGPTKVLKEKLKDSIKIILRSLRKNLKMDITRCAHVLIEQIFGQNLLFEILAFTKLVKFGFPVLPKCKIRLCRDVGVFESITEFDMLVLIEELEYKPILLVEVTTRSTFESLKEKIERIQEAYQSLKEEFSGEIFIPLLIGCKESIECVKKITDIVNESMHEKLSILVLFDFDEFFSYGMDKEIFLEKLKERCKVKLI